MVPSYQLKLDRALEHLGSLYAATQRFIDKEPCCPVSYCETETRQHVIVIKVFEDPPPEFSVLIGDCLHNLRQSLDHLAYRLSISLTGSDPPPNEEGSGFPIHRSEAALRDGLATQVGQKAGDMDPRLYAVLEGSQPYHGGDNELLWRLRRLHDFDKHRRPPIHAAVGVVPQVMMNKVSGEVTAPTIRPGPLEHDTEFFRYAVDAEVDMNFNFAANVAFAYGDPGEGEIVLDMFVRLRQFVRERVILPLEPFL